MNKHFLSPRFVGKRFDEHSIPLDVLGDLAALEDLLRELARDTYLVEEERERLPDAGYFDNVSVVLSGVGEGSAVPVIDIHGNDELTEYFERGKFRLLGGLNAASAGGNVTAFIPVKQLRHFEKLGAHLHKGEIVEFDPTNVGEDRRAGFDTSVRNRLSQLYQQSIGGTDTVTVRGPVVRFDLSAGTFTVRPPFGGAVDVAIDSVDWDLLSTAIAECKTGRKLEILGEMDFKTRKIESPSSVKLLDTYDVRARMDELGKLRRGWLGNNEGRQIDPEVVESLGELLVQHLGDLDLPRLYPAENGGVEAEWTCGSLDVSMEIEPDGSSACVHVLDLQTDKDYEFQIADLHAEGSLDQLREVLTK
jgi:hypothetical protein